MNIPHCPSRDSLLALTSASLDENSAARILEHLDTCADCQETVEDQWGHGDFVARAIRQPTPNLNAESPFREAVAAISELSACLGDSGRDTTQRDHTVYDLPPRLGQYEIQEKLEQRHLLRSS